MAANPTAAKNNNEDDDDNVLLKQKEFIRRMKYEGTLDEYVDTMVELRSSGESRFMLDIIELYVTDSAMVVGRLESEINQTIPSYADVRRYLIRLKGSSASVGGGRMAAACTELIHSIKYYDIQSCSELFKRVKEEHRKLMDTLIEIRRMEETIFDQNAGSQEDNLTSANESFISS
ncbi:Pseudo histidine-containing phosphotransfer protein 1 [Linum grandiflorum]